MSHAAHQENVMQSKLIVAAIAATLSLPVFAQANTPGIDQRQMNQERRIDQGIASGQLTEREALRLERGQERINRMEDRAKADGVVTARERERIRRGAIHRARASRDRARAGAHP